MAKPWFLSIDDWRTRSEVSAYSENEFDYVFQHDRRGVIVECILIVIVLNKLVLIEVSPDTWLGVKQYALATLCVEVWLSNFSQCQLSADCEKIKIAELEGDGCRNLGEDEKDKNHEFTKAGEHAEHRLKVDLDYSEKLVATFKFSVFCPNLSDATTNPDGHH